MHKGYTDYGFKVAIKPQLLARIESQLLATLKPHLLVTYEPQLRATKLIWGFKITSIRYIAAN